MGRWATLKKISCVGEYWILKEIDWQDSIFVQIARMIPDQLAAPCTLVYESAG